MTGVANDGTRVRKNGIFNFFPTFFPLHWMGYKGKEEEKRDKVDNQDASTQKEDFLGSECFDVMLN